MSRMPRGTDGKYVPPGGGVLDSFVKSYHVRRLPSKERTIRYSIPKLPVKAAVFLKMNGRWYVQGDHLELGERVRATGWGAAAKEVVIGKRAGRTGGMDFYSFRWADDWTPSDGASGTRRQWSPWAG